MTNSSVCKRLLISGRVQGVCYRYYLQKQAELWGLSGWCRNLANGTVEAVVSGPAEKVAALVTWCHQGPPQANVEAVQEESLSMEDAAVPDGFLIYS